MYMLWHIPFNTAPLLDENQLSNDPFFHEELNNQVA